MKKIQGLLWLPCGLRRYHCLSALSGFESWQGHVKKLPVTWGSAVVFARHSGFLHHLQLAAGMKDCQCIPSLKSCIWCTIQAMWPSLHIGKNPTLSLLGQVCCKWVLLISATGSRWIALRAQGRLSSSLSSRRYMQSQDGVSLLPWWQIPFILHIYLPAYRYCFFRTTSHLS